MADFWRKPSPALRRMSERQRVAQLEAELEEERRVLRLIFHLWRWTPTAQTPAPKPRPVTRIPTQRVAPPGVPARPRGRLQKGHL